VGGLRIPDASTQVAQVPPKDFSGNIQSMSSNIDDFERGPEKKDP
jgi:hypothetical protein